MIVLNTETVAFGKSGTTEPSARLLSADVCFDVIPLNFGEGQLLFSLIVVVFVSLLKSGQYSLLDLRIVVLLHEGLLHLSELYSLVFPELRFFTVPLVATEVFLVELFGIRTRLRICLTNLRNHIAGLFELSLGPTGAGVGYGAGGLEAFAGGAVRDG